MANRTLARADDARPEILEDGEPHNVGVWDEIQIQRSAAGAPGLMIVANRYDGSMLIDQLCVSIPDGAAFLKPVITWLNGNDPEPWVSRLQGERYPNPDAAPKWIGAHGFDFHPRPNYNQNRADYDA